MICAVLCTPGLAPIASAGARMADVSRNVAHVELPGIGYADLIDCPQDRIRIVTGVFERALNGVDDAPGGTCLG